MSAQLYTHYINSFQLLFHTYARALIIMIKWMIKKVLEANKDITAERDTSSDESSSEVVGTEEPMVNGKKKKKCI